MNKIIVKIVGKNTNIFYDGKQYTIVGASLEEERLIYKNAIFFNQNGSDTFLKRIFKLINSKDKNVLEKEEKLAKAKAEKKLLEHKEKQDKHWYKDPKLTINEKGFKTKNGWLYIDKLPYKYPISYVEVVRNSIEKGYDLNAIKQFLNLLASNPNQYIRDNLFNFFIQNHFPITSRGYIVALRRVWKVDKSYHYSGRDSNFEQYVIETTSDSIETIISAYSLIKLRKKSPSKFYLSDGKITSVPNEKGTIKELYDQVKDSSNPNYTDNHTKTFKWTLKEPCSIPRNQTVGSENSECGKFLHLGSKNYVLTNNWLGNTILLCLVNPANCTNIPTGQFVKFGCCEFYPVAEINEEDVESIFEDPFKVVGSMDVTYEYTALGIQDLNPFNKTHGNRFNTEQLSRVREYIKKLKSEQNQYQQSESNLSEEELLKIVEQRYIEI